MRILRVLRGMVMTAITWAAIWVPVSLVPIGLATALGIPWNSGMSLTRYLIIQAILGAVNGGVFAGVLAIAGRRATFETLSVPLVAACGAVGAALIPFAVRLALSASLNLPLTAILSTVITSSVLGAGCAALTFSIARRAPILPRPDDSVNPPIGAGAA